MESLTSPLLISTAVTATLTTAAWFAMGAWQSPRKRQLQDSGDRKNSITTGIASIDNGTRCSHNLGASTSQGRQYDYDIIVVGAGVVGSALASTLAREPVSRRVICIERSLEMPDRIIGEFLQPGGVHHTMELGMAGSVISQYRATTLSTGKRLICCCCCCCFIIKLCRVSGGN